MLVGSVAAFLLLLILVFEGYFNFRRSPPRDYFAYVYWGPPYEVDERIWAWREDAFERARIVETVELEEEKRRGRRVYWIAFENDEERIFARPPSLIRKNAEQRPKFVASCDWHRQRRKEILSAHPEIGKISRSTRFGIYSSLMIFLIAVHIAVGTGVAFLSTDLVGWVVSICLAATIGAFCAFVLQQLIHETCHKPYLKRYGFLSVLVDFIVGSSGPCYSIYFHKRHIPHHEKTGATGDPDIAFHNLWAWVPKFLSYSRLGRFIWITVVGLFTIEIILLKNMLDKNKMQSIFDWPWALAGLIIGKYLFMGITLWFGGLLCFLYFRLAAGFSFGAFAHPYAGFWLMQHAASPKSGFQSTVSYSGSRIWHWLNLSELYHVEHHDFPWIPFHRIEEVRRIAPEFYETLFSFTSVWRLIWEWLSHTDGSPWMDVAGHIRYHSRLGIDERHPPRKLGQEPIVNART